MKNFQKNSNFILFIFCGMLLAAPLVWSGASTPASEKPKAESTPKSEVEELYDQGLKLVKRKHYEEALKIFEQARQKEDNNPDVLNMLAFTQRKLGMIDEALGNYHRALELKPQFPEAREYLGEAYIQAAVREMVILKGYGKDGEEQLRDLLKAFRAAAAKFDSVSQLPTDTNISNDW